jgi:hypothetical protein
MTPREKEDEMGKNMHPHPPTHTQNKRKNE